MGSFSWLRADASTNTKKINIAFGDEFTCLIPKEFGGGKITGFYQDYGHIGFYKDDYENVKYDMYELLAFWNKDMPYPYEEGKTVGDFLEYDGDFPNLKEIDKYTDNNRDIGIDIGCYNKNIEKLKYPLKLVSVNYGKTHTYEDCSNRSFGDPYQGCPCTWNEFIDEFSPQYLHIGIYKLLKEKALTTNNWMFETKILDYLHFYKKKAAFNDDCLFNLREKIRNCLKDIEIEKYSIKKEKEKKEPNKDRISFYENLIGKYKAEISSLKEQITKHTNELLADLENNNDCEQSNAEIDKDI